MSKAKKLEVIPPEGGWGYVIWVATTIISTSCFSHTNSFGLLYHDFLDEHESGESSVTTILMVSSIMCSLSGIFVNVALKKLSHRQVGYMGAVLYFLGWFSNVFVTEVDQLIITCGFLQGLGLGLVTIISYRTFVTYWVEKNSMMMSFSQLVVSIATLGFPYFLLYSLSTYGFRGTLLVVSGIIAHIFFAVTCLHPVKWHAKMKEVENEQTGDFLEEVPGHTNEISNGTQNVTGSSLEIYTINCETSNNTRNQTVNKINHYQIWKAIVDFFDLGLINDPVYVNISVGVGIGIFNDANFFIFLPLYLYSKNVTSLQVATTISAVALADVLSKGVLAITCKFFQLRNRHIFLVGITLECIARLVFIQCREPWSMMAMAVAMGALRSLTDIPNILVFADHLAEKFIAGMGIYMVYYGISAAALYSLLGYIRDSTNSYAASFYTMCALDLFCIIPWILELYNEKKKKAV